MALVPDSTRWHPARWTSAVAISVLIGGPALTACGSDTPSTDLVTVGDCVMRDDDRSGDDAPPVVPCDDVHSDEVVLVPTEEECSALRQEGGMMDLDVDEIVGDYVGIPREDHETWMDRNDMVISLNSNVAIGGDETTVSCFVTLVKLAFDEGDPARKTWRGSLGGSGG